ncbi:competence protein ComEC [Burkholderia sp. WAC0059]|uniref:ComEC/Rec2 family competence protein n=1 Tax=Burkholderia sp. WAC0059 TaxID=2066022 RepID=UPI000C7EC089|nr:ComEC/Rec2 family competence protein [Burkholderia sp. WAC0059]PLZ02755.1 competence protein ComEC [Burkholderia sp. WAC0059]
MRAVWCGFALGVMVLQQQAALPGWRGGLGLLVVMALASAGAAWGLGARAPADDDDSHERRRIRRRRAAGWTAVWITALCVGFGYAAWRAQVRFAQTLPVALESRELDVSGHVVGLPTGDSQSVRFLFAVDAYPAALSDAFSERLPERLQLTWMARGAPVPTLEPGARWRLPVRLKRAHGNANFGLRDAEAALLERDVRATGYVSAPARAVSLPGVAGGIGTAIGRWRARVNARIDTVLAGEPHRGIVRALATGAQDAISDADWTLMRNTGTSHLVAISGLHIALTAGFAGWIAGGLWRRLRWRGFAAPLVMPAQTAAALGAVTAAVIHAALAGFNVPVQRALWMLGVAAVAFFSQRRVARSQALAWALGLVLLHDPWAVCAAGFWLSFGAVAAILYAASGVPRVRAEARHAWTPAEAAASQCVFGPEPDGEAAPPERDVFASRWRARRERFRAGAAIARIASKTCDSARVQWAVTLALAPLTVYWFAQIPLVGPLANAFAIPWASLFVTPLALAGVVLPMPLDAWALRAAHTLFDWLAVALGMVASGPWTTLRLPRPEVWALACAALGVAWCLAPRGWPLRWAAPFAWLPLLMPGGPGLPDGTFRLTALDVGQGGAVLVQTARHALLFDAGPGPESTHAGERIVVPYLEANGVSRLDALMISHDDSDHSGGARAVLGQIAVRQFVAGIRRGHPLWMRARQTGAETVPCAAGQRWQWDGVEFEVLWPPPGPLAGKTNGHCCVLRVSTTADPAHGSTAVAALLAADIEADVERTLIGLDRNALHAEVLAVPHHGSRTSSTEPFLDSVGPLVALFQVGYRNRFRHPAPGVWARYEARRIVLARSDADGAVRVDAQPGALTVERYRTAHRRYWMAPSDDGGKGD